MLRRRSKRKVLTDAFIGSLNRPGDPVRFGLDSSPCKSSGVWSPSQVLNVECWRSSGRPSRLATYAAAPLLYPQGILARLRIHIRILPRPPPLGPQSSYPSIAHDVQWHSPMKAMDPGWVSSNKRDTVTFLNNGYIIGAILQYLTGTLYTMQTRWVLCVGNRHVTPSSALIDALPYVSRSISFWRCSFLLFFFWTFRGEAPVSFHLYSHTLSFCTSAFHLSHWGTVSLCFFWSCTYYFIPRLTCVSSSYINIWQPFTFPTETHSCFV